jgi:hypothetical protein
VGNNATKEGGDEAPAPAAVAPRPPALAAALVPAPTLVLVPAPTPVVQPAPRSARETQPPAWIGMQSVNTESCGKALRLPRPPTGVSADDGGLRKRATVEQDRRIPKARRVESVEGVGSSSPTKDTTMHDTST